MGPRIAVVALSLWLGGCYAEADVHATATVPPPPTATVEIDVGEPPPPQVEVVVERPGMIWIEGHWYREHNQWAWHKGYLEKPPREGFRWEKGYYGKRHVWVEGHWAH
jgi:hypothetical protein